MAKRLLVFAESNEAQKRAYVLSFYEEHGEAATKEAFGVDRKLIYVWKKRLLNQKGKVTALIPFSTRPHTVRRMQTDSFILTEMKRLRENYPRLGKEKIKPLLDQYCEEHDLQKISISTIGKSIKRHNFFFQKSGRIFHTPTAAYLAHIRTKVKRERVKYAPKPSETGHIQSDVVITLENGIRHYLFNAIDVKGKFAFSYPYKRITAVNNVDFYEKFISIYPGSVRSWQTDNGSENLGVFDERLKHDGVSHYFIYPRCPRINGVIERYNRTIQEEFVECCDILPTDPSYQEALGKYLIFYNTRRVHKSLDLTSPIDYLLTKGGMSKMYGTHTTT